MAWTSDRKLMYPTDVDTLFKLLWAVYDANDILNELDDDTWRTNSFTLASDNLLDFILEHRLDLFELLYRGYANNMKWEYECTKRYENGAPMPTHSYRQAWNDENNRPYLPRELYYAPYNKFGVQAPPALTKLMERVNESCELRGHTMIWHLVTDTSVEGTCTKCNQNMTCVVGVTSKIDDMGKLRKKCTK